MMRKIILSAFAAALIAGSASQAVAAEPHHHARKPLQTTSEQFRNARNAVEQPSQSFWPYAGWSAPAGH